MQNLNQINIVLLPVFMNREFFCDEKAKRYELLFVYQLWKCIFFSHISIWVKVKTA